MIGPAFYPSILKCMMSTMNKHATILIDELRQLDNNTANNLGKMMKFRTLMLFCETSLGLNSESAENKIRMNELLEMAEEYVDYVIYRMFNPWLCFDFMLRFSKEGRKHLKRNEKIVLLINEISEELINSHNSCILSKNSEDKDMLLSDPHHKSFREVLMVEYARNPSFSLEDLRKELMTLILAGADTASESLTWTLWLLGQHECVQEKAYKEIKLVIGDDIRYEDMHKLKYLECIIKESLRLYPVGPIFARYSNRDIQFGKYTITSGTPIVFFSYMLHHNSALYPDPETFDPERFRESDSTSKSWSHIPFAEGVRSCIGKNYAMLEMKVFLARIISNFRMISLTRKEDFEVTWIMMLKSSKPLAMKFIPREMQ